MIANPYKERQRMNVEIFILCDAGVLTRADRGRGWKLQDY